MERIPYQVTAAAAAHDGVKKLPVRVLLENIRSLYNVGAFFRTCDAVDVDALHLCGITGRPPDKQIHKTALGAEESVRWQYHPAAAELARELRDELACRGPVRLAAQFSGVRRVRQRGGRHSSRSQQVVRYAYPDSHTGTEALVECGHGRRCGDV